MASRSAYAATSGVAGAASAKRRGSNRTKARKFYFIQYKAPSKAKGVELLNHHDVFGDGHPRVFTPPGNLDRGFRNYPVRPRFHISARLGRLPNDISQHEAYWLVSDRAKQVLAGLSESDFKFLALDCEVDAGQEPVVFWLCEVMPMLDPVDESRSHVTIKQGGAGEPVYHIRSDMKLFFNEDIVGQHHAFRLKKAFNVIVCDQTFKDTVKKVGLTGLHNRVLKMRSH